MYSHIKLLRHGSAVFALYLKRYAFAQKNVTHIKRLKMFHFSYIRNYFSRVQCVITLVNYDNLKNWTMIERIYMCNEIYNYLYVPRYHQTVCYMNKLGFPNYLMVYVIVLLTRLLYFRVVQRNLYQSPIFCWSLDVDQNYSDLRHHFTKRVQ